MSAADKCGSDEAPVQAFAERTSRTGGAAMQPRRFGFAAAAALALALGGCAAEEPAPESVQPENREDDESQSRGTPAFRALDGDDSGDLSIEEIEAAAESLAALDADGDGRLSGAELRPRPARVGNPADIPEGARIFTLPTDADGEVDMADLPPQLREFLAPADADGDGTASAADIIGLVSARSGEPGEEPGDPEGREGPAPEGSGDDRPRVFGPLATALDTDQDGTVSEAELESAAQSLRLLDRNSDGRLSPDELGPDAGGGNPPE